jgi:hypothetical protein
VKGNDWLFKRAVVFARISIKAKTLLMMIRMSSGKIPAVKRSGYKINAILVDQFQFQTDDSEVLFNLFSERKMNLLKKVNKYI